MPLSTSQSNIDPDLANIIARIESSNMLSAVRFEPDVFSQNTFSLASLRQKIARENFCSLDTAKVISATSYGLYQLMGYNLYGLGFDQPVLYFWNSAKLQLEYFEKFLEREQINYSWNYLKSNKNALMEFAAKYNGDAENYSAAMLIAAKALGL